MIPIGTRLGMIGFVMTLLSPLGCTTAHTRPQWEMFQGETPDGTVISLITASRSPATGAPEYYVPPKWVIRERDGSEIVIES
jgi:hypothetical protein